MKSKTIKILFWISTGLTLLFFATRLFSKYYYTYFSKQEQLSTSYMAWLVLSIMSIVAFVSMSIFFWMNYKHHLKMLLSFKGIPAFLFTVASFLLLSIIGSSIIYLFFKSSGAYGAVHFVLGLPFYYFVIMFSFFVPFYLVCALTARSAARKFQNKKIKLSSALWAFIRFLPDVALKPLTSFIYGMVSVFTFIFADPTSDKFWAGPLIGLHKLQSYSFMHKPGKALLIKPFRKQQKEVNEALNTLANKPPALGSVSNNLKFLIQLDIVPMLKLLFMTARGYTLKEAGKRAKKMAAKGYIYFTKIWLSSLIYKLGMAFLGVPMVAAVLMKIETSQYYSWGPITRSDAGWLGAAVLLYIIYFMLVSIIFVFYRFISVLFYYFKKKEFYQS